jgi:CBS domain containing-hemolysin-like protein
MAKQKRPRPVLWFIFILFFTFAVAFGIGLAAEMFFNVKNVAVCCVIISLLLLIAFLGDIVAVAVAYAELPPFNAMASKKIKGAKMCIKLIKNSDKVSSILSDVLGDVCAIISGVVGATLAGVISFDKGLSAFQIALVLVTVTAIISAIAVSVKSLAKKIAIKNSTSIVFAVGRFMSVFRKG